MSKNNKIYHTLRGKYQNKRRTKNWKKNKLNSIQLRYFGIVKQIENSKKSVLDYPAPQNFSFINNTNEVLTYFNDVRDFIKEKQSVNLDISEITDLTPDTITLLMAKLSEKESRKVVLHGNAPLNPTLKKMFIESGFYNYVNSKGRKQVSQKNKLWKHSTNNEVKGEMTAEAIKACKDLFKLKGINYDTDSLYNLLVEAMSNTMNHADGKISNLDWWLYYYLDEANNTLKFSFIDLGIGIFKSASFDSYKKYAKHIYQGNGLLVKPFLEGKIISSRKTDNAISGKGVQQIIDCAKLDEFKKFIIITNDVKIDVKTKESEVISDNFEGTFIYFEISTNN
jgi:hypothetical protein